MIFDPFCGCGTTIYAAQETQRKWIGCDIAILAIKLIRETLTVELAGFISMKEPTKAMREEAAKAGMFKYGEREYPRLQLLTIKDIVADKREFQTPTKIGSRVSAGQAALPL